MPRFSQRQYEWRVLLAAAFYSAFMLLAWPLVRTTTYFPLRVLLALTPVAAMLYLIVLKAQKILASDELEQRTHLIALGIAMAVVGALSLVGAFLDIAGVLKLDGSILIWVFPVMMFSYEIARSRIQRRYGGGAYCEQGASMWLSLRFVLIGLVVLVIALMHPAGLLDYQLGFMYGTGAALVGLG